jgi:7-cyano-7-deazaguanine synthase
MSPAKPTTSVEHSGNPTKAAVILLSGGLDSATAAAIAKSQGFELYALSFDYGQRHREELLAAERIAQTLGVRRHVTLNIDLTKFGASALTAAIDVPKGRSLEQMDAAIPITYVPARNTVFLSLALAYAEVVPSADIFIGVNAVDYSGYPDCRPEYIAAFEQMANLATKASIEGTLKFKIHTPLVHWSKAEIIAAGTSLGVDYGLTRSCYDPDAQGRACGNCDSCLLRQKGFAEAGLVDPAPYQHRPGSGTSDT